MQGALRPLFLLAIFLFLWVFPATAENRIIGLRTGMFEDAARLVVETSSEVPVSFFLLSNPYRLVIDMPASSWQVKGRKTSGALQTAPLNGYRYGKPAAEISRLVIDLSSPAAPVRAFRLPPSNSGHRLVVDLSDRGETAFQLAARALSSARGQPLDLSVAAPSSDQLVMLKPQPKPARSLSSPATGRSESGMLLPLPKPYPVPDQSGASVVAGNNAASNSVSVQAASRGKWVVFIDAGHGGKDPGAISPSGIQEKDITLMAARELAAQMNATGRIRAVLSRHDDRYYRLRKRIDLARQEKADVFISLHADAAHNHDARGVSVFTLSETASDKEAEKLAAKENKADLIGGPDLGTTDPAVTTALLGMFQRESMNQSSILAAQIMNQFSGLPTPRRGHRFAGFAVLKSPDVPSVLIEMGFLTNNRDERNLQSGNYRRDLMQRITRAVLTYLETNNIPVPENLP